MAKCRRYIVGLVWAGLLAAPTVATAQPLLIEVEGGSAAFLVDRDAGRAFWLLDTCKRSLSIRQTTDDVFESAELRDDVTLGPNRVELRQRFRFDLGTEPTRVEVFNSVRGGWAPVPVRVAQTCHPAAPCRQRTERPECPGG